MELSKELITKAKWVADLMQADGVVSSQVTPEMCLAYMDAIGKKIESIQNIYLTNPAAKPVMETWCLS